VEVTDPGFNQFLSAYDAGPGFTSGENLILTNTSGQNLYVFSSRYPTVSVTNWTLEGQMSELPLGAAGTSRYGFNLNPASSPTYYIFAKTNNGMFTATEPLAWMTTADFESFSVTSSNVTISPGGVFGLASPPVILTAPASTNVFAGKNLVLIVTATGSGALNYQWLQAGAPITDGGNVFGTQTRLLRFVPAATNHTGYYSVIVTNSLGSITSSVAWLTVVPIPALSLASSPIGLVLAADNGAVSNSFVVQMATNLSPPISWVAVQTNVIGADAKIRFAQTNSTDLFRFYRLLFP
jgi:hypothetical protein